MALQEAGGGSPQIGRFFQSEHCLTSIKIIKNEVGCRDDTVPKTVDTRRHCEEE